MNPTAPEETAVSSVEDQLRAMFQADAEKIQAGDLRPRAAFPPARSRRTGWLATFSAGLAGAAVITGILLGSHFLAAPRSPARHTVVEASPAPLSITFTTRTTTVSPPGVAVAVPVAAVHAADPLAAQRVSTAIEQKLADAVSAFKNRASSNIDLGSDPRKMYARITVGDTTTWHHYLSVRFDSWTGVGQEHPVNESFALTFDTATGARIVSTDLFTDITKAGALVRGALLASRTDGSLAGYDLATLSLRPSEDGSTIPLTCYPTAAGLHCLVDQWSLTPYEVGRIEATVPWQRLAALLRPGVGR